MPGRSSQPTRPVRRVVALALALVTHPALAQSGNAAVAETLFQEGRSLYEQRRFDEACPKLAESQRIDPGTGTLLTLALCHEAQGKLASAWAEFTTVEGLARNAGRNDRETIAREHGAALRPRLSTLTVDVPPAALVVPHLELRLNGALLGAATFGVAFPLDGGEYELTASAPGKKPWQQRLVIAAEGDTQRVTVPELGDLPPEPPAAPAAITPGPKAPPAPSDSTVGAVNQGATLRTAGLVTAGAGLLAIGVGTYLALDAKSDHGAAQDRCAPAPQYCDDAAYTAGEDARSQGTVATVVFVLGGAALGTGAALWFLAPGPASSTTSARVHRLGIGPRGVVLQAKF